MFTVSTKNYTTTFSLLLLLLLRCILGAPSLTCVAIVLGLDAAYILVIVILSLGAVGGAVVGAVAFLRRRISLRELERGPNKLLLNSDDLVFTIPKNKQFRVSSNKANKKQKYVLSAIFPFRNTCISDLFSLILLYIVQDDAHSCK